MTTTGSMPIIDPVASHPTPKASERVWLRHTIEVLAAIVLIILLAYLAAAFLPRWWAHRIGHQANGGFTLGIILGLFYGFVFTALPLLTLRWAFHKRRPWKTWGLLTLLAILLAAPNLLTLGIVIGNGHAAHAGQRTLDVDAPGYRNATLAGAITAILVLASTQYLLADTDATDSNSTNSANNYKPGESNPYDQNNATTPPLLHQRPEADAAIASPAGLRGGQAAETSSTP